MDALTALQARVSCPLLTDPGPTPGQVEQLLKAAVRAPDHQSLRPWRFILIEGAAREQMGELLAKALLVDNPGATTGELDQARRKALRAPAIMVIVVRLTEHPKVPKIEQIISAGAAGSNLVTAAFALGIGAYWRSGKAATHPVVKEGLGLQPHEQIVGFVYLGTPQTRLKPVPEIDTHQLLTCWPN